MKTWYFVAVMMISITLTGCLKTRSQISGTSQVSAEQQSQMVTASTDLKIQELQTELRRLNGQIESLQYQLNTQTSEAEKGEAATWSEELIEQMRLFDSAIKSLELRVKKLESSGGGSASSSPSAKTSAEDKAFAVAEAVFDKKDWQKAILAYEKYRSNFPKGKHWGNATYKIGVCFQELNLVTEAKSFFEEAIQKVPKTSAARKSQYRLNQLKKKSG